MINNIMSTAQKALIKILSGKHDKNTSYKELTGVLKREGFEWDLGSGSHQVWRHKDGRKITLPRHGKDMKPIYVKNSRIEIQKGR